MNKARVNGIAGEDFAAQMLGCEIDRNALIDTFYAGSMYEVKSCIEKCVSGKSGRFWLESKQHAELIKQNGFYVLIVFDSSLTPKFSRIVSAKTVCEEFKKYKTLSWNTLFKRIDESVRQLKQYEAIL